MKELVQLMETANKILQPKLAPWQRLDSLKAFFLPSLNFLMRRARLQKSDWDKPDNHITASIKKTLNIPQEVANDYI
jgi:hypothetical protein